MDRAPHHSPTVPVPSTELVLQVQPARAESARDLTGLETAMQSLVLDARSPIALEIAATTTPTVSRSFLLRATNPVALQHLSAQVQSRYPQAHITTVSADPLQLVEQEECSAVELLPGAVSYLPMRAFRSQDLRNEGVDPLLGILAAFNHLSSGARAVVQFALTPASPAWSLANLRRVAEHPLERERQKYRQQENSVAPGMGRIAALFMLVVLLVIASRFQKALVPTWIVQAGMALVQGKTPVLSAGHTAVLIGTGVVLLALLFGGAVLFSRLSARFAQPTIYDQRLVAEKAARPAYQTRLRIFVVTPGEAKPLLAGQAPTWGLVVRVLFHTLRACSSGCLRHIGRAFVLERRGSLRISWHGSLTFAFPRQSFTPPLLRLHSLPEALQRLLVQPRSFAWPFRHVRARIQRKIQRGKSWVIAVRTDWRTAWQEWREWREAMRTYHKNVHTRAQNRRDTLSMLVAAYAQYHLAGGGYFSPRFLSPKYVTRLLSTNHNRPLLRTSGWSDDLRRSPHYVSVAELAALWHLPQAQDLANLSHVSWNTARTLPAPPILTTGQGYKLGSSTHAGQQVSVFLPWSCLRQNMLACASTGKGKSSWLLHLALALFTARTTGQLRGGLMQIDFHGDLHQQTLACIPPDLEDEVVQIHLAERSRLIGLNPLDVSQGADRDKLVDNMIAIIEALWPHSYGPRTENILEYACKTLVEANRAIVACDPVQGPDAQYTLLDVVPLVRDDSFRHAILEQVHDPFIHSWWDKYYEQNDARQQNEYSSSVVTKFSKFASSQVARRILGQPRSTLNFAEIIAQEKILLISCASGEVGSDIAAFVGAVLLGLFHVTLAEQARLDAAERRRFLVLVDEFQALKGVDYQTMLAELRKYGGSFALATQSLAYLDRLDRTLRATVLANIDHLFAFAMSADDAYLLRLDTVELEDVVNLPNYTCYARLLLNGQRLPLFSLHLDDPIPALPSDAREAHREEEQQEEHRRQISLRSHLRYARPVGEIDEVLLSIQAREALTMRSVKKKAHSASRTAVPSRDTEKRTGTQRGTRRRGSGKGGTSLHQAGKEEETGQEQQDVYMVHDLFAVPTREEGETEGQKENDA
ncbi:MAG TPA: type IV secretory system conjugative DNA transfer family protein [Ktedonobacteraceae bacterium]|nr:type IV secretory system conjugative DNA transfer family protein [Ktedonobacteraceae bacterium]